MQKRKKSKLLTSLMIGAGAGALDTLPMLLRKAPWLEAAAPFTHWLMLANAGERWPMRGVLVC